jgi:hypothetical protein
MFGGQMPPQQGGMPFPQVGQAAANQIPLNTGGPGAMPPTPAQLDQMRMTQAQPMPQQATPEYIQQILRGLQQNPGQMPPQQGGGMFGSQMPKTPMQQMQQGMQPFGGMPPGMTGQGQASPYDQGMVFGGQMPPGMMPPPGMLPQNPGQMPKAPMQQPIAQPSQQQMLQRAMQQFTPGMTGQQQALQSLPQQTPQQAANLAATQQRLMQTGA